MTEPETNYLVLARKHRPTSFSGLIGQDAMVRTLKNAIATGRLAQAFILTGVRGVGKTTTARIIARALNCVGPDGTGGPTAEPCGICEHCRAISEDRHVDVIEMDAASRTGVDDIRELIEGVRYRPVSARYKIYIIDEVHMLSKQAFNALLKTLEEPPEHVKFIFATTEVRRVPVTVLSRCQRFDLKRVELETLVRHLARIAANEGVKIAPDALRLIARAADGSVRDALSLLDTAIARGPETPGDPIEDSQVREMLGLADRGQVIGLFDTVMAGEIAPALATLSELYANGADPAVVISDLLDICHWLTRLKLVPDAPNALEIPAAERKHGEEMAQKLSIASLARAWQMLLKGLTEVHLAPAALPAAEMILVRLAYAAELPNPAELVRKLSGESEGQAPGHGGTRSQIHQPANSGPPRRPQSFDSDSYAPETHDDGRPRAAAGMGAALARPARQPDSAAETAEAAMPLESFEAAVALFDAKREAVLHAHLVTDVHLVHFEPGKIEIRPGPHAPANLANRMGELLGRWTGRRWIVTVSKEEGAPSLKKQADAKDSRVRAEAAADPLVRAVLEAFPGSTIERVREYQKPDEDPVR
jgi:DNA polymerase-3 subunit gamma/tau